MPRTSDGLELDRTAAGREKARARMLARIPRWYSPWAHLAGTTGIGLVVLVAAIVNLHHVRAVEVLMVPAVFLLANAFEWRAHRDVLHKRFRPFEVIYERHTPDHHAAYMTNDMEIRSAQEFRLVLIPAMGVLGIVITATPVAMLAAHFLGANSGWLFLLTASLYMVGYEVSHLSYHLPKASFIGSLRLVAILREHHARHHDPRLMQKWNFNVTIPLFDWLHGTIAPKVTEREARLEAESAPRGAE